MTKPIASLSLDLDNKWAYMRTLGVAGWDTYPSYLDVVVPRVLDCCYQRDLRITCFVVGRDVLRRENRDALAALAAAGHEIANHSLNHYPWMHTLSRAQVEAEIREAEEIIEDATGQHPIGFRGPGFSLSDTVLDVLAKRGYLYDSTTLPTFIGPLARWYVRRAATREAAEEAQKRELLGGFRDGFRPIKPYLLKTGAGSLVEIPVTTFPVVKMPIHMTYLVYLWQFSPRLAKAYLRAALSACRWFGVEPSILLHPLDFLGLEDEPDLSCMPGMKQKRADKLLFLNELLDRVSAHFELCPMQEHAALVAKQLGLKRLKQPARQLDAPRIPQTTNS